MSEASQRICDNDDNCDNLLCYLVQREIESEGRREDVRFHKIEEIQRLYQRETRILKKKVEILCLHTSLTPPVVPVGSPTKAARLLNSTFKPHSKRALARQASQQSIILSQTTSAFGEKQKLSQKQNEGELTTGATGGLGQGGPDQEKENKRLEVLAAQRVADRASQREREAADERDRVRAAKERAEANQRLMAEAEARDQRELEEREREENVRIKQQHDLAEAHRREELEEAKREFEQALTGRRDNSARDQAEREEEQEWQHTVEDEHEERLHLHALQLEQQQQEGLDQGTAGEENNENNDDDFEQEEKEEESEDVKVDEKNQDESVDPSTSLLAASEDSSSDLQATATQPHQPSEPNPQDDSLLENSPEEDVETGGTADSKVKVSKVGDEAGEGHLPDDQVAAEESGLGLVKVKPAGSTEDDELAQSIADESALKTGEDETEDSRHQNEALNQAQTVPEKNVEEDRFAQLIVDESVLNLKTAEGPEVQSAASQNTEPTEMTVDKGLENPVDEDEDVEAVLPHQSLVTPVKEAEAKASETDTKIEPNVIPEKETKQTSELIETEKTEETPEKTEEKIGALSARSEASEYVAEPAGEKLEKEKTVKSRDDDVSAEDTTLSQPVTHRSQQSVQSETKDINTNDRAAEVNHSNQPDEEAIINQSQDLGLERDNTEVEKVSDDVAEAQRVAADTEVQKP